MARTDEADVEVVAYWIILGVVDKLMKAGLLSVNRSDEVGPK